MAEPFLAAEKRVCYCVRVPDDDRSRRRLGDDTKARIADLASGWTVESETAKAPDAPAAPVPRPPTPSATPGPTPAVVPPVAAATPPVAAATSAPRAKPRTVPPPPPGSPERKALENKILDTKDQHASGIVRAPSPNPPSAPAVARTKSPGIPAPPVPPPAARSKPTTMPPPPPGAGKIGSKSGSTAALPAQVGRKSGSTAALPLPADAPPAAAAKVGTKSGSTAALPARPTPQPARPTPPPAPARFDDSLTIPEVAPPIAPKLAVPVGEFDSGVKTVDEDKLRAAYAHATVVRDAAEAILNIPDRIVPVDDLLDESPGSIKRDLAETAGTLRGDPTSIDPSTRPFERGDPTALGRGDETEIQGHSASMVMGGKLRTTAALRRKRGVMGDVFYVSTALFGVRRSKTELVALEQRKEARMAERRRHLVTLGRTAVISEGFDHPALGKARESLAAVEEERSKHAGAVAASDTELERVKRDRENKGKQYLIEHSEVTAELADLAKKLEPLLKEAATAKKKAAELRDSLARIEKKLKDTEALLVSVKGEKMDKAAIHADIATLKADRKSVQRDEPVIAAELDALNPRIAAIEAARADAEKRKRELEQNETLDQKRTAELLEAIGAKRKVVDRATAEAEAARDNVLFELGDRLYVDRPAPLSAQLAPIDAIDLELGEDDRRIMELREILSNIDRWKLARGVGVIALTLAVLGGMTAWLIYMLA